MRIVVNDIAASTGGALEILQQFYRYIRAHDASNEWIFLLSAPHIEETERIKVVLLPEVKGSKLKKLRFDLFSGRKVINAMAPDAVLSLQNIITFGVKAPQYAYIHQSIPYQAVKSFSFFKAEERGLAVYQHLIGRLIHRSARRADGVIVQSDWMKEAVAKKAKISQDKIITAMPECSFSDAKPTAAFDPCRFFYPTADAVYKNNDLIVRACELLCARGIDGFKVYMTLPEGRLRHPNIVCTGYLDRERLAEEYASSTLLFPSYIETVGLPLLEAAYFGVPILAADCPHAADVLKGYENAAYFAPFEAAQLAGLMADIIEDKNKQGRIKHDTLHESGWKDVHQYICGKN